MFGDNPIKTQLAARRPVLGAWLGLGHAGAAEMLALAGYDALIIDMEHSATALGDAAHMLRAIQGHGKGAIVRAPFNDPVFFKRVLDMGPDGIMIPMVESAAEAAAAIDACRYPPAGSRGWAAGVARASGYGVDAGYTRRAAEDVVIVCQIESVAAVDNIDAIAAVDGVDALFVGRNDLAASAGRILDLDHDDVNALLARIVAAARAAGRPLGTVPSRGVSSRELLDAGYDLVFGASDVSLLMAGAARDLAAMRGE